MANKKRGIRVLPSKRWLIQNGFAELVKCMEKHPDKFSHIKQNKEPENKENQNVVCM